MKKNRVWLFLFIAALLYAIDGVTKYWVHGNISPIRYSSPFYPYGGIGVFQNFFGIDFSINQVSNQGGAWGIFSSFPIALLVIRILIILSLGIYTFFFNKVQKRGLPLLLILVGASSNILDFFIYGAVVDMFHFVLWSYSFPVFNVADMSIFFGVSTLLIQALIEKIKQIKHREAQPSQN